ncbi:MAG: hypothetical protein V9E94_14720 [Microthrixaceae bacterium]
MAESRAKDRLFRGYGPLIGFAAAFLAVAVLVPSQQREVRVEAANSGDDSSLTAEDAEVAGATETVPGEDVALGADAAAGEAGGSRRGRFRSRWTGSCRRKGVEHRTGEGGGLRCGTGAGRPVLTAVRAVLREQRRSDQPWCHRRQGDRVGPCRQLRQRHARRRVPRRQRQDPQREPQVITKTVDGLVEYFNKRFQFYGRKLEVVKWDGKGDVLKETDRRRPGGRSGRRPEGGPGDQGVRRRLRRVACLRRRAGVEAGHQHGGAVHLPGVDEPAPAVLLEPVHRLLHRRSRAWRSYYATKMAGPAGRPRRRRPQGQAAPGR